MVAPIGRPTMIGSEISRSLEFYSNVVPMSFTFKFLTQINLINGTGNTIY